MSATPAYDALVAHHRHLYDLEHAQAILTWDRLTCMPVAAAPARARAQAALAAVVKQAQDDPRVDQWLEAAAEEPLARDEVTNLLRMRQAVRLAGILPSSLQERKELATGAAMQAWRRAQKDNDWEAVSVAWSRVIDVMREIADRTGDALGLSRMDALLERQEPGLRMGRIQPLFDGVVEWLPPQQTMAPTQPVGPFPVLAQRAVCEQLMGMLGFDFGAGRLDEAVHPFTGGTPEDVRLTTRFDESSLMPALLATLHETGHACYQQSLPGQWLGQPLASPHSASLHEGQALTLERQLGSTEAFWRAMVPLLRKHFGDQPAFEAGNLVRLVRHVRPGLLRVGADALTYPLHIVLRLEVEQALIDGEIQVWDVPAMWDARMRALLDVESGNSFAEGPLQDPHWVHGMFGYFPSYLLGAMVAAQIMEAIRRDTPDLDDRVARGELRLFAQWLRPRVWQQGACRDLDAAMRFATGVELSDNALRKNLETCHDERH